VLLNPSLESTALLTSRTRTPPEFDLLFPVILQNRISVINKINELWTKVLHLTCIYRETGILKMPPVH